MKKIVIIDDNKSHYERVAKLCVAQQASFFPVDEEGFWILSSNFSTILEDGNIQHYVEDSIREVHIMLDGYLDRAKDEDILVICDYELKEKKPEVNGIAFFEQFFSKNVQVIFVSGTHDRDDIERMGNYAAGLKDGRYLSKNDPNFETILRQELDYFLSA